MPYGLEKFKRFAINVWNIDATNTPMLSKNIPKEFTIN